MKKQHRNARGHSHNKPNGGNKPVRGDSSLSSHGAEKRGFKRYRSDDRHPEKNSLEKKGPKKYGAENHRPKKPVFEKRTFEKQPPVKPEFEKSARDRDTVLIWGFHAVRAAWLNPKRRCFRLWLSEAGQKTFEETLGLARENLLKRPDAKHSERTEIDRLTPPGSVHQGILLEAGPLHEPSLNDLIAGDNPPDCLIMLDQVTDPHNIGAILRSAAALGAGGVILTERNAPSMTGVLAKSASGAAEHIPQVHVVNLARALDELRQAGYWSVGLAEEGDKNLDACDLSGRTVLVLGAEGDGLRQLTRKKCDQLARLPTGGPIGSLNVSNAAAVALYEAKRQKTK